MAFEPRGPRASPPGSSAGGAAGGGADDQRPLLEPVSHLYQSFMKDGDGAYLADIMMEGEQSEHEEETGRLELYDHPFNKDLVISEVYESPFRELWMRDGIQTFDPLIQLETAWTALRARGGRVPGRRRLRRLQPASGKGRGARLVDPVLRALGGERPRRARAHAGPRRRGAPRARGAGARLPPHRGRGRRRHLEQRGQRHPPHGRRRAGSAWCPAARAATSPSRWASPRATWPPARASSGTGTTRAIDVGRVEDRTS